MDDRKPAVTNINAILAKLRTDMTLTAPGWAFAAAAIVVLVLLGFALD
ncbi:hypothetical protein [Roseobacter sinensis]|uniref:Uncharacterized protein n=1 Tax=Roseobacter sinensis TaxID=2931391 RepID=A0ABT3BC14_9RHOB|nr:hypothetical protein [Roseobacter sp. WL0113]MCV3271105.1 hypothetical protein [Roseobacter sp. WL0113]